MIYERIKRLCEENETSVNALELNIGVSKGSLCKIDSHKPSVDKIQKIAEELNTSIDYLIYGKERILTPKFSEDEVELLNLYLKLEKEQQDAVLTLLRSFALTK